MLKRQQYQQKKGNKVDYSVNSSGEFSSLETSKLHSEKT